MTLHLTNTITRKKEVFRTILPGKVSIYCCGVTVYDLCHLGHARSYISWDILRRYLMWKGYEVDFVQNFTDIDDKIINRALHANCSMEQISEKNINEFFKDMDCLGIIRPDRMPRATQCLDEIILFIQKLEKKGIAYSINGDVYFSVLKKSDYGKLSGREILDQKVNIEGRIDPIEEEKKQHPFDFALWKKAKEGEPSFSSPWGFGRPGWHIECSAMVKKELGETIDIHLGGADLVFPHHENEIAQSECITGKELARYWLHNGMVNIQGEKMSKSLGNFITIRALIDQGISPMTLRLFVLQAHYRKPLDFTKDALKSASVGWKGLNTALGLGYKFPQFFEGIQTVKLNQTFVSREEENAVCKELKVKFTDAMDDDLNTSAALAVIFSIARPLKSVVNRLERGDISFTEKEITFLYSRWTCLVELAGVLGLKIEEKDNNISLKEKEVRIEQIELLINERYQAKLSKDFSKADKIRDELKEMGIQLIDKTGGITEWIED